MSSSAIKSHAFITYKKRVFAWWKVLKRGRYFILVQGCFHENVTNKTFAQNISRTVTDHVKFFPSFFSLGTLSRKSISWFPSCTVKYISQERHNFNFSYLHMESESGLIFKNISSLANLSSHSSFCILSSLEKEFKNSYTLIILCVPNLRFLKIEWHAKRNQTIK